MDQIQSAGGTNSNCLQGKNVQFWPIIENVQFVKMCNLGAENLVCTMAECILAAQNEEFRGHEGIE